MSHYETIELHFSEFMTLFANKAHFKSHFDENKAVMMKQSTIIMYYIYFFNMGYEWCRYSRCMNIYSTTKIMYSRFHQMSYLINPRSNLMQIIVLISGIIFLNTDSIKRKI